MHHDSGKQMSAGDTPLLLCMFSDRSRKVNAAAITGKKEKGEAQSKKTNAQLHVLINHKNYTASTVFGKNERHKKNN